MVSAWCFGLVYNPRGRALQAPSNHQQAKGSNRVQREASTSGTTRYVTPLSFDCTAHSAGHNPARKGGSEAQARAASLALLHKCKSCKQLHPCYGRLSVRSTLVRCFTDVPRVFTAASGREARREPSEQGIVLSSTIFLNLSVERHTRSVNCAVLYEYALQRAMARPACPLGANYQVLHSQAGSPSPGSWVRCRIESTF